MPSLTCETLVAVGALMTNDIFSLSKSLPNLSQAEMALKEGEVPVGCVIVHMPTRRVLSCGHNETNATQNVSISLCLGD